MVFKDNDRKTYVCYDCKKERTVASFNRAGKGFRRSQCRECEAAVRARGDDRDLNKRKASTRHNIRLRYKVLQHYSRTEKPSCECCGDAFYEFLSLDHIGGGGGKHRAELGRGSYVWGWLVRNNYPPGFRVLCHNCNQAIGAYGFCPHQHPELSLKEPPPLLTELQVKTADERLLAAAKRLHDQGIRLTSRAIADASGYSFHSVEKRVARLRKERRWPYLKLKGKEL